MKGRIVLLTIVSELLSFTPPQCRDLVSQNENEPRTPRVGVRATTYWVYWRNDADAKS